MKIAFDENMPYARELFAPFGEVFSFVGRDCSPELLTDVDVLLVRSITKVNEALLSGANKLQFVGTATIGTDHVDQSYLAERGIAFHSAPGCNAVSVAEYVLSAIKVLEQKYLFSLQDKLVGIVGAGNTGSRLAEKLDALGVSYMLCDPPLEEQEGDSRAFVGYEQLLQQADIISFHVPLVKQGAHATWHLLDAERLKSIKSDAVIINACRGEVIDNKALLAAKRAGMTNPLVLDVWEGEPDLLHDLIEYADIATAHIAGYSFEGKAKGSFMLYQALCQHLAVAAEQQLSGLLPKPQISGVAIDCPQSDVDYNTINRVIHLLYDVRRDDGLFRQHINGNGFDWIRKNYPIRREFSALAVTGQTSNTFSTLAKLGFHTLGE